MDFTNVKIEKTEKVTIPIKTFSNGSLTVYSTTEVEKELKRRREIDPDFRKACELLEAKRVNDGLEFFYKAAKNDTTGFLYCQLGILMEEVERWDEAIDCFIKALKLGLDQGTMENNIGVCYANKKDYVKAVQWYQSSANRGNSSGQYNLGVRYYHSNNIEPALKYLTLSAEQGDQAAIEVIQKINSEKKNSSSCFLTTAMCEILGEPDNCYELESLRNFRDNYLLKNEETKQLVEEYYAIAPPIAERLKNSPKCKEIAKTMHNRYINTIIQSVNSKDYSEAIEKYKDMVFFLSFYPF